MFIYIYHVSIIQRYWMELLSTIIKSQCKLHDVVFLWLNVFSSFSMLPPFLPSLQSMTTQIAKFMGPTWGPPGSCRPRMGPMLVPWTLLSGYISQGNHYHWPLVMQGKGSTGQSNVLIDLSMTFMSSLWFWSTKMCLPAWSHRWVSAKRCKSSVLAIEVHLSCTNLSTWEQCVILHQ